MRLLCKLKITSTKQNHISTTLPFSVEKRMVIKHESKQISASLNRLHLCGKITHKDSLTDTQTKLKRLKHLRLCIRNLTEKMPTHTHNYMYYRKENIRKKICFL